MAAPSEEKQTRIQARIDADEALVTAIDTALLAITTTKAEEFWLDTGEGKQRITQLDIEKLDRMRERAINRIEANYKRLNGKQLVDLNLKRKGVAYQ
jgi:uncharacterized protein YbcI